MNSVKAMICYERYEDFKVLIMKVIYRILLKFIPYFATSVIIFTIGLLTQYTTSKERNLRLKRMHSGHEHILTYSSEFSHKVREAQEMYLKYYIPDSLIAPANSSITNYKFIKSRPTPFKTMKLSQMNIQGRDRPMQITNDVYRRSENNEKSKKNRDISLFHRIFPNVTGTVPSETIIDESELSGANFNPFPDLHPSGVNNFKKMKHKLTQHDMIRCGFSSVNVPSIHTSKFKIVGGREAKLGSWPWIAAMGFKDDDSDDISFDCGGSLISNLHVLTAAHCLVEQCNLYSVRLGELDLNDDDDGATPLDILVDGYVIHASFDPETAHNDIGLVYLQKEVTFTALIHPICLPRSREMRTSTFDKMFPYVAGWGNTRYNGSSSSKLLEVQLPVVKNDECRAIYNSEVVSVKYSIVDSQICAGYKKGGKDACQGDSGGPFMLPTGDTEKGRTYYLIGIVSMGDGCAFAGIPGILTRVSSYISWIDKAMQRVPFKLRDSTMQNEIM